MNQKAKKETLTRGEDFAYAVLSEKQKEELIAWAESEIVEYKKFIKIIKGGKKC